MKKLVILVFAIISVGSFARDNYYCNGQVINDGIRTYYPSGEKARDSFDEYYPSGIEISSSWGVLYPDGTRVVDSWGVYYPDGNLLADRNGCYDRYGSTLYCDGTIRINMTAGGYPFKLYYNVEKRSVEKLTFRYNWDGIRISYDVVNGELKNLTAKCW